MHRAWLLKGVPRRFRRDRFGVHQSPLGLPDCLGHTGPINQSPTAIAESHIPQLATLENNGVLRLNIGAYAPQRLYNSATDTSKPSDGNETLTVSQVYNPDGSIKVGSVFVSGFRVSNPKYIDGVTEIEGEGLAGNDKITVNVGSGINVNLEPVAAPTISWCKTRAMSHWSAAQV